MSVSTAATANAGPSIAGLLAREAPGMHAEAAERSKHCCTTWPSSSDVLFFLLPSVAPGVPLRCSSLILRICACSRLRRQARISRSSELQNGKPNSACGHMASRLSVLSTESRCELEVGAHLDIVNLLQRLRKAYRSQGLARVVCSRKARWPSREHELAWLCFSSVRVVPTQRVNEELSPPRAGPPPHPQHHHRPRPTLLLSHPSRAGVHDCVNIVCQHGA